MGHVVALAVSNIFFGMMFWLAVTSARTIIVPTHLKAAVEYDPGSGGNPGYVRAMCGYMATRLYAFTPATIANNFAEFQHYVPSDRFDAAKSKLNARLDEVQRLRISEDLQIEETHVLPGGVCLLKGMLMRSAGGRILGSEDLLLRINYRLDNGGFWIEDFDSLDNGAFAQLMQSVSR